MLKTNEIVMKKKKQILKIEVSEAVSFMLNTPKGGLTTVLKLEMDLIIYGYPITKYK
jgi:hypothetical protein